MFNYKKRFVRVLLLVLLCCICYLFGLFTHLLEKDIRNFKYAQNVDIHLAIQNIQNNHNKEHIVSINEINYDFLYKAENTCDNAMPYLVILVKSKITNFEQRNVIRDTWGAKAKSSQTFPTHVIFLIGVSEHTDELSNTDESNVRSGRLLKTFTLNKNLSDEYEKYGDLVQQNFHDTYFNNTLKALMGLKWIDVYCPDSKYYLFIDDDYYLNPNVLTKYLSEQITDVQYSNLYAGFVFENSSPMRHLLSKWYVSLDEYPYDKFPPYVSAGCYLLSSKSARLFYIATKLIKLFRFDDIYLGILAYRLNIQPLHIENIYFYEPYFENNFFTTQVIASHGFSPQKLIATWQQLKL
jgi:hypothetical protein